MTNENPDGWMLQETLSQPEAWSELIPHILSHTGEIQRFFSGKSRILFSGCGSGLNASRFAAPLFQSVTGINAKYAPAADVFLFEDSLISEADGTAAVLQSRSGSTTEVLRAMENLKRKRVPVLGITCGADSPLALGADLALVLHPVQEQAVTTTRSLTGMMITCQLLAALAAEKPGLVREIQHLPDILTANLDAMHTAGRQIGEHTSFERVALVANGPFYGAAREGQLKFMETCLIPADAYPMLDYRHGPQAAVQNQLLLICLVSRRGYPDEAPFVTEMKALGATTVVLCDQAGPELRHAADILVEFNAGLSDFAAGPMYLPVIQTAAYYHAHTLGLNPDEPRNLSYWIDTSSLSAT
ncbi:MAG: SIS domain-containing protein [Anaerolineales bacterium]|nr:SIS domain-containing protein [Anaerolineales bacterium]